MVHLKTLPILFLSEKSKYGIRLGIKHGGILSLWVSCEGTKKRLTYEVSRFKEDAEILLCLGISHNYIPFNYNVKTCCIALNIPARYSLFMPFTLPALPYEYNALEPYIDAKTMEIHYTKHHQAYTDKLNAALEKYPEFAMKSIEEILKNINALPEDIRTAVRNNGGGYYNHTLFWENMVPQKTEASTELAFAIADAFGSMDEFTKKFTDAATTRFGSGWAWLVSPEPSRRVDERAKLEIITTANQDSPISEGKKVLLGLDVWEHAYYLNYQNRRPEYIEAFWKIVNWEVVSRRYSA